MSLSEADKMQVRDALTGIKSHEHTAECDSEHGYSFHANECLNCWPGRVDACEAALALLDAKPADAQDSADWRALDRVDFLVTAGRADEVTTDDVAVLVELGYALHRSLHGATLPPKPPAANMCSPTCGGHFKSGLICSAVGATPSKQGDAVREAAESVVKGFHGGANEWEMGVKISNLSQALATPQGKEEEPLKVYCRECECHHYEPSCLKERS